MLHRQVYIASVHPVSQQPTLDALGQLCGRHSGAAAIKRIDIHTNKVKTGYMTTDILDQVWKAVRHLGPDPDDEQDGE